MTQTKTDLEHVANAVRAHERFVVTTHENPDGDALGSLLGTKLLLDALGKETAMYLAGTVPPPREYRFMPLEEVERGAAPPMEGRVLVAVDCANESRLGRDAGRLLD
ncbi:MAG TPA: bifunctional oligoribonuclease/PAP phosphatase NrnA, partial [Actinomycetota bacterium]|nr:bifunctional oligoribonuclease/PAP phosphatase NrnA [Actinomycetota bacterium]